MSDLISRSAVIDIIHRYSCNTARIEENVLDLPTAYDVDKVVEELEKLPNREADYYYANSNDVIDREDAIDIVKRGGVE